MKFSDPTATPTKNSNKMKFTAIGGYIGIILVILKCAFESGAIP